MERLKVAKLGQRKGAHNIYLEPSGPGCLAERPLPLEDICPHPVSSPLSSSQTGSLGHRKHPHDRRGWVRAHRCPAGRQRDEGGPEPGLAKLRAQS